MRWRLSVILLVVSITVPVGSSIAATAGVVVRDQTGTAVTLYAESHALVIGVSEYQGAWPSLPGVREDVTAVADALRRHGFQVQVVEDPEDGQALEAAYEEFILKHGLEPANRLLFYFAGHGYTHKPEYASEDPEYWTGFIVAGDAPDPKQDLQEFYRNAVSMRRFEELAERIEARHALFVFDSCFSGTIFSLSREIPASISYRTARPVRQFISSGEADETVPDLSVFRRQFVAGIAGEADGNRDHYVTGVELGEFLYDSVINYTHGAQHPQYGKIRRPDLDKGDFVFALQGSVTPTPPPPPPVRFRGNVQVNVNVPAVVYFDDVDKGRVGPEQPLNESGVRAGVMVVRVEAEGYQTQRRSVEVRRGQWEQLVFNLQPVAETAQLTIRSNVRDDRVFIDDLPKGSTGTAPHQLTPGTHRVRVEKAGYEPVEQEITLDTGEVRTLRFVLRRMESAATPKQPLDKRPWLGVLIQDVTEELAKGLGLEQPKGALIARVQTGSPAAEAGLQEGDVLLALDDKIIETPRDLTVMVAQTPVGKVVSLRWYREGAEMFANTRLAKFPGRSELSAAETPSSAAGSRSAESPSVTADGPSGARRLPMLAISVADLTSLQRETFGVGSGGVQVIDVGDGPAKDAGIRPKDLILRFNHLVVEGGQHLQELTRRLPREKPLLLLIQRESGPVFVAVRFRE